MLCYSSVKHSHDAVSHVEITRKRCNFRCHGLAFSKRNSTSSSEEYCSRKGRKGCWSCEEIFCNNLTEQSVAEKQAFLMAKLFRLPSEFYSQNRKSEVKFSRRKLEVEVGSEKTPASRNSMRILLNEDLVTSSEGKFKKTLNGFSAVGRYSRLLLICFGFSEQLHFIEHLTSGKRCNKNTGFDFKKIVEFLVLMTEFHQAVVCKRQEFYKLVKKIAPGEAGKSVRAAKKVTMVLEMGLLAMMEMWQKTVAGH
ncbi:hypothetical protein CAEBREN_21732 [Caenorhabditis brenneri]|uniref:Uncharacterized protein n=1 Tax=Caenorhabditis brenneri TaxID=135651 RepID=G0P2U4_CAEBE|nr:hypothetical protein CAEBREN_21732 [Caenorhabditis brenneri]